MIRRHEGWIEVNWDAGSVWDMPHGRMPYDDDNDESATKKSTKLKKLFFFYLIFYHL